MPIWHRFLALFCCLSAQTTGKVPRLTVLSEPTLMKWVNSFLTGSGEKTRSKIRGPGQRFAISKLGQGHYERGYQFVQKETSMEEKKTTDQ